MKLLKESIIYKMPIPTEEEVAEFVACHLPSEECVKTKIFEINPGFNYEDNIYFKIKDKIESVIRSTIEEFSCDEADAVSYIDIVFDDIKAHAFNDPELESIYDVKEPVEIVDLTEEVKSPKHLRDVLKGIDAIYIYNDARQAHLKEGLTESNEEEDFSSDEELLSWPDDKLLELSNEKIHQIRSLELIHRIAMLDKSRLSAEQLQSIQEIYKQKWLLDEEDVKNIIDYLKDCHRLYIAERPKNESLLRLYDLDVSDCLDIIHELSAADYIANTKNTHYDYLGNNLIIFEPTNIQLSDGRDLGDLIIYVKLDLGLEEGDHSTTAVSFHRTNHEDLKPYKSETEEQPLEEAVQIQYFRITYKHETGIYATDAVEASTYDEAVKIFNERGKGELISCDPISKEEYDEIIEGLGTESIEESVDESRYHPSRYSRFWWGIIDSNNGLLMRVGPDADYSKPLDDAANKLLLFKSKEEAQEYIDKNLVESLTEDLNVNVDTDKQNINVAAEENAAVEVKVAPKEDCIGAECDAEAELAELAKDPKYAKAFAYLMSTLQGETAEEQSVIEEPAAEMVEESEVESEPLTESIEEATEEDAEGEDVSTEDEVPQGPANMYAANTLNELTKSEYETINQYNDFLLAVQNMVARPEGVAEEDFNPQICPDLEASIEVVIKDILAEENKHIGQLQELLKAVSPNAENIEAGAGEAEEQMEEVAGNDA